MNKSYCSGCCGLKGDSHVIVMLLLVMILMWIFLEVGYVLSCLEVFVLL